MPKSSMRNIHSGLPPSHRPEGGYTLIEMGVVLLVLGTILATIGSSIALYLKNEQVKTTLNNASLVTGALNTYLIQHGAYPCPARMDAKRIDPDYGFGGDCSDTTTVTIPGGQYGQCVAGYCVQLSDRAWGATPPANWVGSWPPTTATGWTGRVRRGMVPFRDLGIPEFQAEDGYHDRFEYAVTEALAVKATYNRYFGGIDIINDNQVHPSQVDQGGGPINGGNYYSRLVATPPGSIGGSVHYVIISNGPDRAGAFTHEGGLANPCPGTAGTLDAINCYISNTNMPPAVYRLAMHADTPGATHFDDTVKFYSSVEIPLWQVQGKSGLDLGDLVAAGDAPTAGKVGIDMAPDPAGVALQVGVDMLAEKNLETTNLLDPNTGTQSIPAAMNLKCTPDPVTGLPRFATGFKNGQLNCASDLRTTCPSGQALSGIDPSGNLICQAVVSCAQKPNVKLCPNPSTGQYDLATIPPGYPGDTYTTPVDGDSYTKTFQCVLSKTGGASWKQTATSGVCVCDTTPYTKACYAYLATGCPNCWSGGASFSNTCPGGTPNYISNNCTCANYTDTSSTKCPAGFTGTKITSTAYTCDPSNPTAPAVAGPTTTTGTCTCDPTTPPGTQAISCQAAGYGAGFTGSVTQSRTYTCSGNTGTWSAWTTTKDTCKCSAVIQYQQIGCPLPQVGTQYQSQTYDCTANAWGPWTTYSNTCGAVVHTWEMASSPTGTTSTPAAIQVGQSCTTVGTSAPCSASAGSGSYYQYPVCQCQ